MIRQVPKCLNWVTAGVTDMLDESGEEYGAYTNRQAHAGRGRRE